jgi:hypothetical protein
MKAKQYDLIKTLVDLRSDFSDRVIPAGTVGTVVEAYERPREGYAVDLAIPDAESAGGSSYENLVLYPLQFVVVRKAGDLVRPDLGTT